MNWKENYRDLLSKDGRRKQEKKELNINCKKTESMVLSKKKKARYET